MSGEHPVVVIIYLFTVLCGVFTLCGLAAEFLKWRELARDVREQERRL